MNPVHWKASARSPLLHAGYLSRASQSEVCARAPCCDMRGMLRFLICWRSVTKLLFWNILQLLRSRAASSER